MTTLKEAEIKEELCVCPYCMNDWNERKDVFGCCGEVHSEKAYLTFGDELFLESEVIIQN